LVSEEGKIELLFRMVFVFRRRRHCSAGHAKAHSADIIGEWLVVVSLGVACCRVLGLISKWTG